MAPAPDAWQKTASLILTKYGLMQSLDRLRLCSPDFLGSLGYLGLLHVLAKIVFTLRPHKSVGLVEIDLLLVDQDLSANLLDSLRRHWLPLMFDKAGIGLRGNLAMQADAQSRAESRGIAVFDKALAASGIARGAWIFAAAGRQDHSKDFVIGDRPARRFIRWGGAENTALWDGVADG